MFVRGNSMNFSVTEPTHETNTKNKTKPEKKNQNDRKINVNIKGKPNHTVHYVECHDFKPTHEN